MNELIDRRQNPRFACGGKVKIVSLPLEGLPLDGRLLDLSLGGCCVESQQPLPVSDKAEIILQVNAASFRALAEIKTPHEQFIRMQFLKLTRSGQELLREILGDAARLHTAVATLRGVRNRHTVELCSDLLRGYEEMLLPHEFPVFRAAPAREEEPPELAEQARAVEGTARILTMDDLCQVAIDVFA